MSGGIGDGLHKGSCQEGYLCYKEGICLKEGNKLRITSTLSILISENVKQTHPKFNIFLVLLLAIDCPSGYQYQAGDKVGSQTEIEKKKVTGIEQCGKNCDSNENCRSIEWSDSEKNCVLLIAQYTDGQKWKDYRFCSKVEGE